MTNKIAFYIKVLIAILIVTVGFSALRNKIYLDRCSDDLRKQIDELKSIDSSMKKIEMALINSQTASIKHLGNTIILKNIEQVFPKIPSESDIKEHPRLLLIFSELSCNVCQDEETQFAINIATQYGKDHVMAIVHASNRRYVANFIRMNQVNFPVYFSKNESFMKMNGVKYTPMLFVLDENNRVIASLFPIPNHFEFSEPFHQFCYHYFNKNL